jgi:uncharacterized membrane protein YbhN (UPF0104 family)
MSRNPRSVGDFIKLALKAVKNIVKERHWATAVGGILFLLVFWGYVQGLISCCNLEIPIHGSNLLITISYFLQGNSVTGEAPRVSGVSVCWLLLVSPRYSSVCTATNEEHSACEQSPPGHIWNAV